MFNWIYFTDDWINSEPPERKSDFCNNCVCRDKFQVLVPNSWVNVCLDLSLLMKTASLNALSFPDLGLTWVIWLRRMKTTFRAAPLIREGLPTYPWCRVISSTQERLLWRSSSFRFHYWQICNRSLLKQIHLPKTQKTMDISMIPPAEKIQTQGISLYIRNMAIAKIWKLSPR